MRDEESDRRQESSTRSIAGEIASLPGGHHESSEYGYPDGQRQRVPALPIEPLFVRLCRHDHRWYERHRCEQPDERDTLAPATRDKRQGGQTTEHDRPQEVGDER